MDSDGRNDLDRLDDLSRHLRPIEHLFMVMGEVGNDTDGGQLACAFAEIGLALTAHFRDQLDRSFRLGGEAGGPN